MMNKFFTKIILAIATASNLSCGSVKTTEIDVAKKYVVFDASYKRTLYLPFVCSQESTMVLYKDPLFGVNINSISIDGVLLSADINVTNFDEADGSVIELASGDSYVYVLRVYEHSSNPSYWSIVFNKGVSDDMHFMEYSIPKKRSSIIIEADINLPDSRYICHQVLKINIE